MSRCISSKENEPTFLSVWSAGVEVGCDTEVVEFDNSELKEASSEVYGRMLRIGGSGSILVVGSGSILVVEVSNLCFCRTLDRVFHPLIIF